jgi:hypothetical protein
MSRSTTSAARKRPADASRAHPVTAPDDAERAADAPHYQTFTVRFLVDPSDVCRRTEVAHVQAGASEAWSGYDQARLARWIAERVQPLAEAAPPPAPSEPPQPEPTLQLGDLGILRPEDGAPAHLFATGQPFALRLTLALSGADEPGAAVGYSATAYAYGLAGGERVLGAVRGQIQAGAATAVELSGSLEQPGPYRLKVRVALDPPYQCGATLVGGLLQIVEGDL